MSKNRNILTLGVDLGGTKIETALVDVEGNIITTEKHLTHPNKGADGIIEDIVQCIKNCLGRSSQQSDRVGVGVAGQVHKENGVIHFAPNLRWHEVPLKAKLEEALGLPVAVNNDVRAATWAEWKRGAGKGVDDLLCLFIGTGIGGGVVSGGNLLEGCGNTAGELGHVPIVANGRKCHCRNRGCLEAYAGGWAIAERAIEAANRDLKAARYLTQLAGAAENITAKTVTEAFRQGDTLARQLVKETTEYLATGVTGFVNSFNPCRVVFGGGVIDGLPEYVDMIAASARDRALEAAVEKLEFNPASLGDRAVVIGAALLANQIIDT